MKKLLTPLFALTFALSAHAAPTAVVRPASDFAFPTAGNKNATLKSLRGQAVVLIVADSAKEGAVKKQVRFLESIFQQFAGKQVVFAAALKNPEPALKSNIPFAIVNNGAAVASSYGVNGDFNIVIIGKDGNVDYQTDKVLRGERVRDVVQNSFAVQAAARK